LLWFRWPFKSKSN